MGDLIERLREDRDVPNEGTCQNCDWALKLEAAAELTRLNALLTEAQVAMKPFAAFKRSSLWPDDGSEGDEVYTLTFNPPGHGEGIKGSDFRLLAETAGRIEGR